MTSGSGKTEGPQKSFAEKKPKKKPKKPSGSTSLLRLFTFLLLILNLVDVLSTRYVLNLGAKEANPLLENYIETGWVWLPKIGLPLVVIFLARKIEDPPKWIILWVGVAVFFYAAAVGNNLGNIGVLK